MKALFTLAICLLLAGPAAAQMQDFTAPQYAALRDSAATLPAVRLRLREAVKSAKAHWNAGDSLNTRLRVRDLEYKQVRFALDQEMGLNHRLLEENENLRRLVEKDHLVPYYYTRPPKP